MSNYYQSAYTGQIGPKGRFSSMEPRIEDSYRGSSNHRREDKRGSRKHRGEDNYGSSHRDFTSERRDSSTRPTGPPNGESLESYTRLCHGTDSLARRRGLGSMFDPSESGLRKERDFQKAGGTAESARYYNNNGDPTCDTRGRIVNERMFGEIEHRETHRLGKGGGSSKVRGGRALLHDRETGQTRTIQYFAEQKEEPDGRSSSTLRSVEVLR